jgi:hypothetical protein
MKFFMNLTGMEDRRLLEGNGAMEKAIGYPPG